MENTTKLLGRTTTLIIPRLDTEKGWSHKVQSIYRCSERQEQMISLGRTVGYFRALETMQSQLKIGAGGGSSSVDLLHLEMRLMMPNPRKKQTAPSWPQIGPGNWRGEIVGSCSLNFGQVVQDGPPRQAVEFTYMVMPAALTMPEGRFTWPGVIMITTPTPMKTEFPDAGHLFKADHAPSLQLSLGVTRNQFSDMLRMVEAGRLKDLHFTVEEGADGSWPVYSWGLGLRLG